jgi:hypothetical protein
VAPDQIPEEEEGEGEGEGEERPDTNRLRLQKMSRRKSDSSSSKKKRSLEREKSEVREDTKTPRKEEKGTKTPRDSVGKEERGTKTPRDSGGKEERGTKTPRDSGGKSARGDSKGGPRKDDSRQSLRSTGDSKEDLKIPRKDLGASLTPRGDKIGKSKARAGESRSKLEDPKGGGSSFKGRKKRGSEPRRSPRTELVKETSVSFTTGASGTSRTSASGGSTKGDSLTSRNSDFSISTSKGLMALSLPDEGQSSFFGRPGAAKPRSTDTDTGSEVCRGEEERREEGEGKRREESGGGGRGKG